MAQHGGSGQGSNHGTAVASISAGVVIVGTVECSGELQISGRVEGEIRCATVFVDEHGVVDGSINAERLRICGAVTGSVVTGDLAVEAGGSINGETSYARLKVASGGVIAGSFVHRAGSQTAEDGKSLKLVSQPEVQNPRRVYVD